jgi:transposase, IS6 family
LGFKSFGTAFPAVAGSEAMAMIRKGQAASAPVNDIRAESYFIAMLFSTAA